MMTLQEVLEEIEQLYPQIMFSDVKSALPFVFAANVFREQAKALLRYPAQYELWFPLSETEVSHNMTVGHLRVSDAVFSLVWREPRYENYRLLMVDRNEQILDHLVLGRHTIEQVQKYMNKYAEAIRKNSQTAIVRILLVEDREEGFI